MLPLCDLTSSLKPAESYKTVDDVELVINYMIRIIRVLN